MGSDSTPGGIYKVNCPHCEDPVFFVLAGGPTRVACRGCGAPLELDVVHDGRKWTVRRLRPSPDSFERRP